MSYVHSDDKYQQLTTLRERLSDEVGMQIGIEFPIFQDTKDIQWGQNWEQRINNALDQEITFLIPIITPSFFNSQPCRDELERFLAVEKRLERNDLILPIYFVETPLLNDPELRATDELADIIASRQYADWRDLRFEPFTNPVVGKTLAQLASQIRDALPRIQKKASTKTAAQLEAAKTTEGVEQPTESRMIKVEPPTVVVDLMHRGNFTSITEAIKKVEPGTRILVRKGLYKESLVIDKPLEIIGEGEGSDIVIQANGKPVIRFQTSMGRMVNLTLQQMGGTSGEWFCVDIAQGRLELEDCDMSSQSLACVGLHGGADPRLRRNRIHDSKSGSGVFVFENAQGTFEDNDIFGNSLSGITIKSGGNSTVRRNRIHNNSVGIHVHDNGEGTFEDNDILSNALSGVQIVASGNPTLRRNHIHDNKENGLFVFDGGLGTFEENDIFGNGFNGVSVKTTGNPIIRNNRVNKNVWYAVRVYQNGHGTFENNDLTKNTKGAWSITADSEANITRTDNEE